MASSLHADCRRTASRLLLCGILCAMRFRFDMYLAGDTPVSRCDPRVKIVLLAAFSIAVLVVRTWWGLALLGCILVAVLAAARIPLARTNRSLAFVYVLAAFSFVFNVIAHPDAAGALAGANVAVRMVVLVAGSFAVCFSTPATKLVDALRSLMSPLRVLRVPVDDIAVTLSMALRFVPVIGEELVRVRTAQVVRGAALPAGANSVISEPLKASEAILMSPAGSNTACKVTLSPKAFDPIAMIPSGRITISAAPPWKASSSILFMALGRRNLLVRVLSMASHVNLPPQFGVPVVIQLSAML